MKTKPKTKPEVPKKFPLFPHANGSWAKKIAGVTRYFGPWDDPQGAKKRYEEQYPWLIQGRLPPDKGKHIGVVVESFLTHKRGAVESGDLAQATYTDYERIAKLVEKSLGSDTPASEVDRDRLERLRMALCKGARGPLGPVSQKRRIGMARVLLNFANDELDCDFKFRKVLRMPSAKAIRGARNKIGERLFTPAELNALIESAKPQLKAMILLAANAAFGNADCATIQIENVDIANGWHNHPRPKTEVARRAPLWPETTAALYRVIKDRKTGPVFITKYGNPWIGTGNSCPISYEFRKLCVALDIWRPKVTSFYTIRRTFETVAQATGDQVAVSFIMGHAPASNDMAAVYRQKVFDSQLQRVVDHVRKWLA